MPSSARGIQVHGRLRLVHAGVSDVGRRREHNEDAWGVDLPSDASDPHGAIFIVSDGVGGQEAGEKASAQAVETLIRSYRGAIGSVRDALELGFNEANRVVVAEGESDAPAEQSHLRRAATLVAAVVVDDAFTVAHVGDSRAYLVRGGVIRQLTTDHTLAMEWVRQGRMTVEQAEKLPQNNIITRAIGRDSDLGVDVSTAEPLQAGDRLVLCSDGLTKHVETNEIAALASRPPEEAVKALVDLANSRGGSDNITVILVQAEGPGDTQPSTRRTVTTTMPMAAVGITQEVRTRRGRRLWPLAIAGLVGGIACIGISAVAAFGPFRPTTDFVPGLLPGSQATATVIVASPTPVPPTQVPPTPVPPTPTAEPTATAAGEANAAPTATPQPSNTPAAIGGITITSTPPAQSGQ